VRPSVPFAAMSPRARALAADALAVLLRATRPALQARRLRLARRQGVRRPAFVLSLDCDTDLDLDVVPEVHGRLVASGILPVYAVPGALLEAGADVYRPLAAEAEFLNHGQDRHCRFDPERGSYESWLFYDQEPWEIVEADVRAGHATHERVLGRAPRGFRAPHFGTLHGTARLRQLHALLVSMGYEYSSSTMPLYGLVRGPVVPVDGLLELPVNGYPMAPNRVLDSWSARYAPERRRGMADFEEGLGHLLDELLTGRADVVHVYADPSQVVDWPGFFKVVARGAPVAVPSLAELVARVAA
jgi:hypothetical protein